MGTENQQAPEQLFESMNAESKRLLQGLMRSEDTADIVKNLTGRLDSVGHATLDKSARLARNGDQISARSIQGVD